MRTLKVFADSIGLADDARAFLDGNQVVGLLDSHYPQIKTPLRFDGRFQLLIATMLSAQCTDAQVNKVTENLFAAFPSPESMSRASIAALERIIKPTGFFHVKARRVLDVARKIVRDFGGRVPDTMEDLTELPGVGRKTANIVLSVGFNRTEGVAVDTHVKRLSERIGLSNQKSPEKIEIDLMRITSKELWPRLSMLLILHGRSICKARNPLCEDCVLSSKCRYYLSQKIVK